jgi:hypothetical protein
MPKVGRRNTVTGDSECRGRAVVISVFILEGTEL